MLKVTDETFCEIIKTGSVVVDCSAVWCGPCRMLAPVLEELSKSYPTVAFYSLDVDECPKSAEQLHVHAVPTVFFYKDGKVVDQFVGAQPRKAVEPKVKNIA